MALGSGAHHVHHCAELGASARVCVRQACQHRLLPLSVVYQVAMRERLERIREERAAQRLKHARQVCLRGREALHERLPSGRERRR